MELERPFGTRVVFRVKISTPLEQALTTANALSCAKPSLIPRNMQFSLKPIIAKTKPSTGTVSSVHPRYWLMNIAVSLGKLPLAERFALAILVSRPSDTLALQTLAKVYSEPDLLTGYLTAMSKLGKFDAAMDLVWSVAEQDPTSLSIPFWRVMSTSLFQRGYDLPARQILQRLVLENPEKHAYLSILLVRFYSNLGLHEEALVPGEIALRSFDRNQGKGIPEIINHARNLIITGEADLAEGLLRRHSTQLDARGYKLLIGLLYYQRKDLLGVLGLCSRLPEKFRADPSIFTHHALALARLDQTDNAVTLLAGRGGTGCANLCLTAYGVYRHLNLRVDALNSINEHLISYDYAPLSKSWSSSGFLLTELRTEPLEIRPVGELVSVIMTVHKINPMLDTAVRSVLEQTHGNLELLLIDDGSSEEDAKAYELFTADPRVRVLRQSTNSGTYACRNVGIRSAGGEFITFMDSDDWQHPQKIAKCIERMKVNKTIVATVDSSVRLSHDGHIQPDGGAAIRDTAFAGMFWRAGELRWLGGFDEVRVCADAELLTRAKAVFGEDRIHNVPVVTYIATHQTESLTGGGEFEIGWKGLRGSRAEYRARYRAWHAKFGHDLERLRLLPSDVGGRFPAPSNMPRAKFGNTLMEQAVEPAQFTKRIASQGLQIHPRSNSGASRKNQRVVVCMATYPDDFATTGAAVESLLNQSTTPDEIRLYVNQSSEPPVLPCDDRIKVEVTSGPDYADMGKLKLAADIQEGIVLLADADLLYPMDYVEAMIKAVNRYGGDALVGVHGTILPIGSPIRGWLQYLRRRILFHFGEALSADVAVNILGTGTMAYDASIFKFPWSGDEKLKMADIYVAVAAQDKEFPMVSIKRGPRWVSQIAPAEEGARTSIWTQTKNDRSLQRAVVVAINSIPKWTLIAAGADMSVQK